MFRQRLQSEQIVSLNCFNIEKRLSLNDYFISSEHWIKINFKSNLVIDEEVMLNNNIISAQTLLDTDAEINLISQYFVIEHQLFSMKRELSQSQFLNRQKVYCFKAYWVKYCFTDNWKQL